MRTYSYASMIVDGNETAKLEIFGEHNMFSVFEHDVNVFTGSFRAVADYVEKWKAKRGEIRSFLEAAGHSVTFEQTIK